MMKNTIRFAMVRLLVAGLLGVGSLSVTGCSAPDAPPPPPLPATTGKPAIPLSVSDVVTLQGIQEQALMHQKLATLAATHSESPIVQAFATSLAKDYKGVQDRAEKIAKSASLALSPKLDDADTRTLHAAGQHYLINFDNTLLWAVQRPMLTGFRKQLQTTRKQTKVSDLSALAKDVLNLDSQYRKQARAIMRDKK